MKILIVESPGKVKKIQSFLGSEWKVAASVGHVRDLPQKKMGVETPLFKPTYEPTERGKDVLKRLAGLTRNADEVYLATDPDREGEAIAWHLQDALKLKNPKRITFTEITEKAVKTAIDAPSVVNMALVQAQEGRRVLDRFCGYLVSGPLSNSAGQRLSAGRVQSPAVRLVVDREREINAFKAVKHYGAEIVFENWKAIWKPVLSDGQEYILDKKLAEKASLIRSLAVLSCTESETKSAPPAPFTTSTLQQAASASLKYGPKKTMGLAQKLYEQGAITYMRTDSPNLSEDAIKEARLFCESQGWPLVPSPRTWKSKDGAQEAHEAIRPTDIAVEEAGESVEEQALYRLIRERVLASMLADAVYAVRTLILKADDETFEARGKTLLSQGWKVLTAKDFTEEDTEEESDNPVPSLAENEVIDALDGKVIEKSTKPPSRFTEASLVKELERRGIGRPSTYASILDTIQSRQYVLLEKRNLVPTPAGEAIVDGLKGKFTFIDFDYTKTMENSLDLVAEGKSAYLDVVKSAFDQLQKELLALSGPVRTCPECGKPLRHNVKKDKWDFYGCTGYPECKYTENPDGTTKKAVIEEDPNAPNCPKCKKKMRKREGKYGLFYGCSGYPECKQIVKIQ